MPPRNTRSKLRIPLVDCELTSHAHVTSRTDRNKVVEGRSSALGFWNIMTALVVECVHPIRAPNDLTLYVKLCSNFGKPHLFPKSLWDLMLCVH